jgi:hypothetical protein
MEKLTSTGEAWIEKELKRLEGILGKKSMAVSGFHSLILPERIYGL